MADRRAGHALYGCVRVQRRRGLFTWAALLATLAVTVPSVARATEGCTGDVDRDGIVTVNEIIIGINIALGNRLLSAAPSFDYDGDGQVTVGELIRAVEFALGSCPVPVDSVEDDQVVETSSRLAVTAIGEVEIIDFAFVGTGLTALRRSTTAGAAAVAKTGACSGGGMRIVTCRPEGGGGSIEQTLTNCREVDPDNEATQTQSGTRTLTVPDPNLCSRDPIQIDPSLPTTEHLSAFHLDYACTSGCTAGLTDVTLRATDLRLDRRPNGAARTTLLNGDLTVDNHATGERFAKTFMDFTLAATAGTSGASGFALDGRVMVDCLNELSFTRSPCPTRCRPANTSSVPSPTCPVPLPRATRPTTPSLPTSPSKLLACR